MIFPGNTSIKSFSNVALRKFLILADVPNLYLVNTSFDEKLETLSATASKKLICLGVNESTTLANNRLN